MSVEAQEWVKALFFVAIPASIIVIYYVCALLRAVWRRVRGR